MHDSYIPFLSSIAALVGMGALVFFIISRVGGWSSLGEQYRSLEPFAGSSWGFQSAQLRWGTHYNNCLTVGADPHGLFLWIFPLFRVSHPALFIPWREISVSRKKVFWIKQVELLLDHERKIPFTIREGLAQRLQTAAGSSWPELPSSGG